MTTKQYPSCPRHPYAGFRLLHKWGGCECPKCHRFIGFVEPTDPPLLVRPACPTCGQTGSVHLMRTVQVNGKSLVYWHCEACDKFASQPLPHDRVRQYLEFLRYRLPDRGDLPTDIDGIRTRYDYRESEPCFVCGSTAGTEYHHFLPATFRRDPRVAPNWSQWDLCGVRLCRPCHELWHELVAPMALLAGAATNGVDHA